VSRDFNGSTGDLAVAAVNAGHLRISLPITVACWVRPDTLKVQAFFTNNKTGAGHSGMWFVMSDTSGNLEASYGDNTGNASTDRRSKITSGGVVTTGAWQHVCCRIRGVTDADILVAGADVGGAYSGTGGNITYDSGRSAVVGAFGGGSFFDGRIAEVGFWSVSLSDGEVLALAKGVSPLNIRYGALLAYFPTYGQATPEIDLSTSRVGANLEGTAPVADHSPTGPPVLVAA